MIVCDICGESRLPSDVDVTNSFVSFPIEGEKEAVCHVRCVLKNLRATKDSRMTELRFTYRNPDAP